MDKQQEMFLTYALAIIGAVLILLPPQMQYQYLPMQISRVDQTTKQIIGAVALLGAFYLYNGKKFF